MSAGEMTPRLMPVLQQCIERGIDIGWNRAHKHNNAPQADYIHAEIENAIWHELHEWFQFEQPSEQSQD